MKNQLLCNKGITLKSVSFLTSAETADGFPKCSVPEIAIMGRSNAGKSSVLNTICNRKNLAYTSKTPGKTRLINFFSIIDNKIEVGRLVDLPGYGYAKVDKLTKSKWNKYLLNFLVERKNLVGYILVTDCRHPIGSLDRNIMYLMRDMNINYHILFNKVDKISNSQRLKMLSNVAKVLKNSDFKFNEKGSFSSFSSLKKIGTEELLKTINQWIY